MKMASRSSDSHQRAPSADGHAASSVQAAAWPSLALPQNPPSAVRLPEVPWKEDTYKKVYSLLIRGMDPQTARTLAFEKNLTTPEIRDRLRAEQDPAKHNESLLAHLEAFGTRTFVGFVEMLKEMGPNFASTHAKLSALLPSMSNHHEDRSVLNGIFSRETESGAPSPQVPGPKYAEQVSSDVHAPKLLLPKAAESFQPTARNAVCVRFPSDLPAAAAERILAHPSFPRLEGFTPSSTTLPGRHGHDTLILLYLREPPKGRGQVDREEQVKSSFATLIRKLAETLQLATPQEEYFVKHVISTRIDNNFCAVVSTHCLDVLSAVNLQIGRPMISAWSDIMCSPSWPAVLHSHEFCGVFDEELRSCIAHFNVGIPSEITPHASPLPPRSACPENVDWTEQNFCGPLTMDDQAASRELGPGERSFRGIKVKGGSVSTLLCATCNCLLFDAVQSSNCGCRFCAGCLENALREAEERKERYMCPSCQLEIEKNQYFPDVFAERDVRATEVFCAAQPHGCKWEGLAREYHQHATVCSYMPVKCMNAGCTMKVPRHKLTHHQEAECAGRRINCTQCNQEMTVLEMDKHLAETCPKGVVVCENGCGAAGLLRSEIRVHNRTCQRVKVRCYYSGGGCEFHGYRGDLPNHHSTNMAYHMKIIHQIADSAKQESVKMRQESSSMHQEMQSVHGQTRQLNSQLERLSTELQRAVSQVAVVKTQMSTLQGASQDHGRDLENQKRGQLELSSTVKLAAGEIQQLKQLRLRLNSSANACSTDVPLRLFPPKAGIKSGVLSSATTSGVGGPDSSVTGGNQNRHQMTTVEEIERKFMVTEIQLSDISIRQDLMEVKGLQGVLVWRISDIRRRAREASDGRTPSLYSPPFFTSQAGYKMCTRLYLNGDGSGKDSHMSLFFVVMRGDFDALLPWPFQLKVKMSLLDQTPTPTARRPGDIVEVFYPDVRSSSFQRPSSEMNIATGCPLFAPQSVLSSEKFVRDDTILIRVEVGRLDPRAPAYIPPLNL